MTPHLSLAHFSAIARDNFSTENSLFRQLQAARLALARGEINDVDQNFFYVSYDRVKFKELFGIEM
jgi:hypothetical protein